MIFESYANRLVRMKRAPRTQTNFRLTREKIGAYCASTGIAEDKLEEHDIEEWLASLDVEVSTKRLHLDNVRAAYSYAARRGQIKHNPAIDVVLENVPDKEPRIISAGELRTMKASLVHEREWRMFHLLTYTGMRRNEIRTLPWGALNLPAATITVTGKGGKLRHIPIHPALGEVLGAARPSVWVLPSYGKCGPADKTIQEDVSRFAPGYSCHDFRRTVASSLYANGVETDLIDRIMGWAPRSVRSRYYVNVAPAVLQRAVLRLYADDPV